MRAFKRNCPHIRVEDIEISTEKAVSQGLTDEAVEANRSEINKSLAEKDYLPITSVDMSCGVCGENPLESACENVSASTCNVRRPDEVETLTEETRVTDNTMKGIMGTDFDNQEQSVEFVQANNTEELNILFSADSKPGTGEERETFGVSEMVERIFSVQKTLNKVTEEKLSHGLTKDMMETSWIGQERSIDGEHSEPGTEFMPSQHIQSSLPDGEHYAADGCGSGILRTDTSINDGNVAVGMEESNTLSENPYDRPSFQLEAQYVQFDFDHNENPDELEPEVEQGQKGEVGPILAENIAMARIEDVEPTGMKRERKKHSLMKLFPKKIQ